MLLILAPPFFGLLFLCFFPAPHQTTFVHVRPCSRSLLGEYIDDVNDRCYAVSSPTTMNWNPARAYCQNWLSEFGIRMYLASYHSISEFDWWMHNVWAPLGHPHIWVGFHKVATHYEWSDGSPVDWIMPAIDDFNGYDWGGLHEDGGWDNQKLYRCREYEGKIWWMDYNDNVFPANCYYDFPSCGGIIAHDFNLACAAHGACYLQDNCTCDEGYMNPLNETGQVNLTTCVTNCYGLGANVPEVCSGPSHGRCVAPNTCACDADPGWWGDECEHEIYCYGKKWDEAGIVCSGHGDCLVRNDSCACDEHHLGVNCEIPIQCWNLTWDDPLVCTNRSRRGECRDEFDNCECNIGFDGPACEYFVCNGYWENDHDNVCSNHGTCVEVDTCDCDVLWDRGPSDPWCSSKVTCGGYEFDSPYACRSRGKCVAQDLCECKGLFGGKDCELAKCFGFDSDDEENVCSGHGICYDFDLCMCARDYYGRNCEEHFPEDSVLLEGFVEDVVHHLFVPYLAPKSHVPFLELPYGSQFVCVERLIDAQASGHLIGMETLCRWEKSLVDPNMTAGVNITLIYDEELPFFARKVRGIDVEFRLLTSDNPFERVEIGASALLVSRTSNRPGGVNPLYFVLSGAIGGPLLLLILLACGSAFALCICVASNRKRTRDAMAKMLSKTEELREVHDTMLKDTERLQKELRLQQIKGLVKQNLPDDFVQLSGLNDEEGNDSKH